MSKETRKNIQSEKTLLHDLIVRDTAVEEITKQDSDRTSQFIETTKKILLTSIVSGVEN